jgi:hypothetical protein
MFRNPYANYMEEDFAENDVKTVETGTYVMEIEKSAIASRSTDSVDIFIEDDDDLHIFVEEPEPQIELDVFDKKLKNIKKKNKTKKKK